MLMVLIAAFAQWIATIDPDKIAPIKRNREPTAEFWFGTDMLGRDLFSRVVYGARVSLLVGFAVAVCATFLGLATGLAAGAYRRLDMVIMRLMDGLMSVPPILLAIALMAAVGGSVFNVILAISIAEFPRMSRLVRGLVLSIREQAYIDGAIASGSSMPKIIVKHILPNTLGPVMVQATYICSAAMITEAALSFIGAGTPPSIPSWGGIMNEGRMLWQIKPYIILFPAVFLSLTVLAVNLLGDGLRDALDPRAASRI
ncbi:peptide ABC transporter permease [Rhizobium yanglingense]|nr:peptide ABC transporter permease [Rhizobium yanglingense]